MLVGGGVGGCQFGSCDRGQNSKSQPKARLSGYIIPHNAYHRCTPAPLAGRLEGSDQVKFVSYILQGRPREPGGQSEGGNCQKDPEGCLSLLSIVYKRRLPMWMDTCTTYHLHIPSATGTIYTFISIIFNQSMSLYIHMSTVYYNQSSDCKFDQTNLVSVAFTGL